MALPARSGQARGSAGKRPVRPRRGAAAATAPLPILYEDAQLLVIDKPAGLAVHPGPRTPRSLEDRLDALRLGYKYRPRPAHRLDRDTSGCLVLARGPRALKRLGRLFEAGAVEKDYVALLAGDVKGSGLIDAPLRKVSGRGAGWRMIVAEGGKPARTRWRALGAAPGGTLVAFRPETGRTHQIRVHAAHALAPIAGDPVYGGGSGPMRLHAARVAFDWSGGRRVDVAAPAPGWAGAHG